MAILMYCHMFAVAVPLGHAFYIGLGTVKGYLKKNQISAWLIASVLSFVLFLPWLSSVSLVIDQSSKLWREKINPFIIILSIAYLSINRPDSFDSVTESTIIFSIVVYTLAFLFPLILGSGIVKQEIVKQEITKPGYEWLRQFYWIGVGSILSITYIFSNVIQAFRDRYVIHLIIFALLLFIIVLNRITAWCPKWLTLSLPFLICLPFWIPQLWVIHSFSDSCAYKAVQPILTSFVRPKDLVVCAWEVYMPELSRELPNDFRLIAFPDTERVSYINFNELGKRIREEQSYQKIEKIMLTTLSAGGTVWFIEHKCPLVIPQDASLQIKPEYDFTYAEYLAMRRLKNWLLVNAERVGDSENYRCYYAVMTENTF